VADFHHLLPAGFAGAPVCLRFAQRQSQPDAMTWRAAGAAKRAAFLQPIGTPPESEMGEDRSKTKNPAISDRAVHELRGTHWQGEPPAHSIGTRASIRKFKRALWRNIIECNSYFRSHYHGVGETCLHPMSMASADADHDPPCSKEKQNSSGGTLHVYTGA
jgi:hypothetical protein